MGSTLHEHDLSLTNPSNEYRDKTLNTYARTYDSEKDLRTIGPCVTTIAMINAEWDTAYEKKERWSREP